MENKFNISDIIRYMLIGFFFTVSLILIYCVYSDISLIKILNNSFLQSDSVNGFPFVVLFLLFFYFTGIIIQGINKMFTNSFLSEIYQRRKKQQQKGIPNHIKRLGYKLYYWLFFRFTPDAWSHTLKRRDLLNVPKWIKISKNPSKIMEHIKLSMELKGTTLNINEYFHFSELFQGLYISSIILTTISITGILLTGTNDINNWGQNLLYNKKHLLTLSFFFSAALSYKLSSVYAKRAIMTLDIKKEALDLDVSKNIKKTGIQQVYILIRTHRPNLQDKSKEDIINYQLGYLNNAIRSVGDQDYYHMNILLLGEIYCDKVDSMVKELSTEYINKLYIQYCFEKETGIAQSSRSIRNQILDITDDDDIIIFLNDDDFFCRNNAISEVVYRMNSLNANLCLTAFNINSQKDGNIVIENGRMHNTLVRKLSQCSKAITQKEKSLWHFASTISWTKIYRAKLLNKLNNITKEIKESEFEKLTAFEDFMDYLVFLLDDIKVTAVGEPVYSYRKHNKGNNNHKRNKESFKNLRIGYLRIVKEIAELVYNPENQEARCNKLFKRGVSSKDHIKSNIYEKMDIMNVYRYLGFKIHEIAEVVKKSEKEGYLTPENLNGKDSKEWFISLCKAQEHLGDRESLYWEERRMDNNATETTNETIYFEEIKAELDDFEFS
jgi:hypothetical protein